MKKRKKLCLTLFIIGIILLTCTGSFFIYTSIYYHALEDPLTDSNVLHSKENNSLHFYQKDSTHQNGFIFYPGAKVEYTAYAPLCKEIVTEDMEVFLVHMPFNLAFFQMDAAGNIMENHPEITHWYIGGHSLGGAIGASWSEKHQDQLEGIIFLGSYATHPLKKLRALSLYGSNDQVVKKNKIIASRDYFASYEEHELLGGNHANFGNYGVQKKDGVATLSKEKQWKLTSSYIQQFII